MRKRRVILFGRDPALSAELGGFFDARGYETVLFREPAVCPVAGRNERCPGPPGCGDIVLIRHDERSLNAIELLAAQGSGGCGLSVENKAIISPSFDEEERSSLAAWGAPFFTLPIDLRALEAWVAKREARMDLSRPVAIKRMEERVEARHEQVSLLLRGTEVEQVFLVNKSGCGVCVRTSRRLVPNQMLRFRLHPEGVVEDAIVRWIRPDAIGTYLVGLSCCA